MNAAPPLGRQLALSQLKQDRLFLTKYTNYPFRICFEKLLLTRLYTRPDLISKRERFSPEIPHCRNNHQKYTNSKELIAKPLESVEIEIQKRPVYSGPDWWRCGCVIDKVLVAVPCGIYPSYVR